MTHADPRLHELFDAALAQDPERAFLHLPRGRTVSYRELERMAAALAQALSERGVRAGDRVVAVAENCPEHIALVLACSRIGAWSCGVNARMAPNEITAFVDKADARLACFTVDVSSAAAQHAERFGARPSAVPGLSFGPVRTDAVAETGALAVRVAAIIFTSGTTGAPKGVMVTHAGIAHFARVSAQSRLLGPDDRSYAFVPMTHIFGLGTVLMASLHAGASLVMRSRFDPDDLLDALAHGRVSQLQGPPTMFSRLLAHFDAHGIDRPAAPHLRYLYTGAGPLDLALKQRVEACFGMPLHHGYALSEYAGSLHITPHGERRADTSAGKRVDGAQLRIVDGEGRDLPAGEAGEIWLRGVGLMPGYFRDEAATAQVMRPGGWYASGDLGRLDADGSLFVVGRSREMIIRSGFNVYPAEVEAALQAFPAIHGAAVTGRAEADGNEEILAFVILKPGHALDARALDAHLRERLAPYKRPSRIRVVDAFPMTHSGKIVRSQLPGLLSGSDGTSTAARDATAG